MATLFHWRPDLHPRDYLGRFEDVPEASRPELRFKPLRRPTRSKFSHFSKKRGYRVYHRDRKKLHDEILTDAIVNARRPTPGQKPTATLLIGGPGSGKNYLFDHGLLDIEEGSVVADPDAIKEKFSEYQYMIKNGQRDAAHIVHDESQDVAKRLQYVAQKLGYDLTMIGTGAWPEGDITRKIEKLHRKGYDVHIVLVDASVEKALERNSARDRQVNPHLVKSLHRSVARRLPEVLSAGAERVTIYRNDDNPVKVAEFDNGAYRVLDEGIYDSIFEKADAKL